MMLNGVVLEDGEAPPLDAVREMAECFIDEYARLGFDANRILHMFRTKGYAGPYMATEILGEEAIRDLVDLVLARWGGRRAGATVPVSEKREISLTGNGKCENAETPKP
jgi:hypothetical protein